MQEDDPDGPVVWARILDVDGEVAGPPFRVQRSGADAIDPAVAVRGRRDEFLVAWTEVGFQQLRVVARRFDGDGNPVGDEVVISEAAHEPAVAYSGKRKEFTIVWQENGTPGISGVRLPAGPSAASEPFRISRGDPSEVSDLSPEIACDSRTGGCLVVWERYDGGSGQSRALARLLPAQSDESLGRQRKIAERGSVGGAHPDILYNRDTREYLAFWGGSGSPARRMHADGRPYGGEVRLNQGTSFEDAGAADIAVSPDGHYEILFWGDELDDYPGSAVFRRRMGAELKLRRRLSRVSSADPRVTGLLGGAIAYSRAGDRFRAVWVEGREQRDPEQFPGDPPSNWEVWARVL